MSGEAGGTGILRPARHTDAEMDPTDPPPVPPPSPPVLPTYGGDTWAGTRALMSADYRRLLGQMESDTSSWLKRAFWFLLPNFLGIVLYRIAHFAYVNDWRNLGRAVFLFNLYLTRMEITPQTVIGPGVLVGHATGVTLDGHIGARCHVLGLCNTGGGFGEKDVGAGAGLPSVGDDVTIGYGAMVLGGIRIGDGARIGPGAVVTTDVAPGALVMWTMPRTVLGKAAPGPRHGV